jgi:hypothetical protein
VALAARPRIFFASRICRITSNHLNQQALMTRMTLLTAILCVSAMACAQEIPPGTALPLVLTSTLDAAKVKPEQPVSGRIEQDVPLASGAKIRAGSRVNGRVLQAGINADGSSYIRLRFDQVRAKGHDIPVTTSLRALASWWAVQNAQLPSYAPRRGEAAANWTTTQVGGDVVYRGGGHVMHGEEVVGAPAYRGVLAELISAPEAGCPTGSGGKRLALWVFASSACGAYGFDDLRIAHAGDTEPVGEIVLQSNRNLQVRGGSGMLLITTQAQ